MLRIAFFVIALASAAIVVRASTMPDTFRIERTVRIEAPAERIFPLVNDLHRHIEWSPWEKKDPAMARSHTGAPSGRGAIYEWDGNGEIGKGRMEIVQSDEPGQVVLAMDFLAPFEAHNTAEFVFDEDGDATTVTWAMYGPQQFLGKVMSVFMDMDAMIGTEFETGLANLKSMTEAAH